MTLATVVRIVATYHPNQHRTRELARITGEAFSYIGISPAKTNEGLYLAVPPACQIVLICTFQLAVWPSVKPDDEAESTSYASA